MAHRFYSFRSQYMYTAESEVGACIYFILGYDVNGGLGFHIIYWYCWIYWSNALCYLLYTAIPVYFDIL